MKKYYKSLFKALLVFLVIATLKVNVQAQATATAMQSTVTNTNAGSADIPVLIVKISVTISPYYLYALFLSTAGSNNPAADITNAKVYYSGNSNIFSTATQYSTAVTSPNGFFTIGSGGPNFQLLSGDNYFWVCYDVQSGALNCDTLDALCSTVYGSNGTITPAVTDPPGNIIIGTCGTGIENSNGNNIYIIYANPLGNELTILINLSRQYQFTLYNSSGKKVIDNILSSKLNTIDLKSIPGGIYFYEVADSMERIKSGKIVKL